MSSTAVLMVDLGVYYGGEPNEKDFNERLASEVQHMLLQRNLGFLEGNMKTHLVRVTFELEKRVD